MNKAPFFISFILSLLFLFSSCGKDLVTNANSTSSSSLTNGECACNTLYSPLCGSDGKTYDNLCIATCFSVTEKYPGNCACSKERKVCGDDGKTYDECSAQDAIVAKTPGMLTKIVKFADCAAVTY